MMLANASRLAIRSSFRKNALLRPRIGIRTYRNYQFRQPVDATQVINGLIGVNVGVFVMWHTLNPKFMVDHFTCSPGGVMNHLRLHTLFTSTISHQDFWHLLSNMFGLYFFGGEVCRFIGPRKFLGLYIGSGVLASAMQCAEAYYNRRQRWGRETVLLGASGSVNSVVVFNVLLWPRRILLLYGIVPVPAIGLGLGIVLSDFWSQVKGSSPNVGHMAHLTGAGVGFIYWLARRGRFF